MNDFTERSSLGEVMGSLNSQELPPKAVIDKKSALVMGAAYVCMKISSGVSVYTIIEEVERASEWLKEAKGDL